MDAYRILIGGGGAATDLLRVEGPVSAVEGTLGAPGALLVRFVVYALVVPKHSHSHTHSHRHKYTQNLKPSSFCDSLGPPLCP